MCSLLSTQIFSVMKEISSCLLRISLICKGKYREMWTQGVSVLWYMVFQSSLMTYVSVHVLQRSNNCFLYIFSCSTISLCNDLAWFLSPGSCCSGHRINIDPEWQREFQTDLCLWRHCSEILKETEAEEFQTSKQAKKQARKEAINKQSSKQAGERTREHGKNPVSLQQIVGARLSHLTTGPSEAARCVWLWAQPGQQTPHRQRQVIWWDQVREKKLKDLCVFCMYSKSWTLFTNLLREKNQCGPAQSVGERAFCACMDSRGETSSSVFYLCDYKLASDPAVSEAENGGLEGKASEWEWRSKGLGRKSYSGTPNTFFCPPDKWAAASHSKEPLPYTHTSIYIAVPII